MATKKKLLEAAAGAAGGGGLNVEDVFSTYLYTGNGSTQTITNGIDLAGEGGLVWIKSRTETTSNMLSDSERALTTRFLRTDLTNGEANNSASVTSHNSDGFTLGGAIGWNTSGANYASWTFRKAPKFFDVVTYTGDGVEGRTVSHNLGSVPGLIIVKCTSATGNWWTYHRSLGENKYVLLNSTQAEGNTGFMWSATAPTSTEFTLGNYNEVNGSGKTFVAYLFAHNNGDGDFGPTGDQDIIKCGSYVGDDLDDGPEINLGFEPQWLLVKNASTARNWIIVDNMRGIVSSSTANDALLYPNLLNAEDGATSIALTPTGFKCIAGGDNFNGNGHTMIYIAIRRGPMAVPESATDVFAPSFRVNSSQIEFESGFPVDMYIRRSQRNTVVNTEAFTRLQNTYGLYTNSTAAESNRGSDIKFDRMDGVNIGQSATDTNRIAWMWRRAPSFMDVVTYKGTGNTTQTKNHKLGVVPEMIWAKRRDAVTQWGVYHKDIGYANTLVLNDSSASQSASAYWKATPTDTEFYVGTGLGFSGANYVAYLFATLDGISKVGSYTGNGSTQTINCGFSSGARFVLIKRTDSTGDWYVWDAERGIVSANDPHLSLNTTAAEVTTDDSVDPVSSGFAVNQVAATNINVSSASYIFYAIA